MRYCSCAIHLTRTATSPAQIIFGCPLRDGLMFVNKLEKFSNPYVCPLWHHAWAAKEDALWTRIAWTTESLKAHSKPLRPLFIDERVFLQNQQGHHPTKWDRSGTIVESTGHDQYRVNLHTPEHPQAAVEPPPVDAPTAEDPQAAVESPPVDAPTAEDPTPTSPAQVIYEH